MVIVSSVKKLFGFVKKKVIKLVKIEVDEIKYGIEKYREQR
jgi:hypothetical protein